MRFSALIFIFAAQAFAQSFPEAAPLLTRQQQELERYHSYEYIQEVTTTVNLPGLAMPGFTMTTQVQAINPGKRRQSTKTAGMDASLVISNGDDTWFYQPLTKSYTRFSGNDPAGQDLIGGTDPSGAADLKQMSANAKVTGSELLTVDGEQRDCWVIESKVAKFDVPDQAGAIQDAVFTTWVDKDSGMQWKTSMSGKVQVGAATPAMSTTEVTLTHSLKINPDLDDSLFVFTPPAGATESNNPFAGIPGMAARPRQGAEPAAIKKTPAAVAPGEPEAFVPDLTPTERVEPVDPKEVAANKLQGFVQVLVAIDATGRVTAAEALTGPEALRTTAVEAVKQWTFHPVIRDGDAVAAYTDTTLSFPSDRDFSPPDGADFDPAAPFDFAKLKDFGFDPEAEARARQRIQELETKFPRSPEQVLADTQDQSRGLAGAERIGVLPDLAKQALDAGDFARASSYANELLQMTKEYSATGVSGASIYDANSVLGLAALRQGSVSEARQYLLEAGKAPAPVFEPFPDLTLARELLAKGERGAVLEFLAELKGFWKSGAQQLDEMIAAVRAGKSF